MKRSITQMSNNRARLVLSKKIACNNRQSVAAENSRSGVRRPSKGFEDTDIACLCAFLLLNYVLGVLFILLYKFV